MMPPPARWAAVRLFAFSLLLLSVALLGGCKQENKYVAPPPPQVGVALPLQQAARQNLELTGNTEPYNQVDVVARVQRIVSAKNYTKGTVVKRGDQASAITPPPYHAQLQHA